MRFKHWDQLSGNQQHRYTRVYGLNARFHYESGRNLQAGRGHKPREHVTRRERNPLGLTSADYAFLKKQQIRNTPKGAAKLVDFSGPIRTYKRFSPKERQRFRERVANDNREYRRRKGKPWRTAAEFKSEIVDASVGRGTGGRRVGAGTGGGGGGGGGDSNDDADYPEGIDFDQYEDDYPDFDDDLYALSFYH